MWITIGCRLIIGAIVYIQTDQPGWVFVARCLKKVYTVVSLPLDLGNFPIRQRLQQKRGKKCAIRNGLEGINRSILCDMFLQQ